VQIDPETGPKRTFLNRRCHKPVATTAPKAVETLAFSSHAPARRPKIRYRLQRDVLAGGAIDLA